MSIKRADREIGKGWYTGPWDSDLNISIGYANRAIDEPHVHSRTVEIYMVARGKAEVRVEQETIALASGDVLVVDPGKAHTFLSSSPDYFHFVIQSPGFTGQQAKSDKALVARERLGFPADQ